MTDPARIKEMARPAGRGALPVPVFPGPGASIPVPSVPALVVRTFGHGAVLIGDQEAQWHAASARELFFYLLSFPEGRTRSEILEDLWGLDDNSASANRFRVTVHRLRSALGRPDALGERFGRFHLSAEVFGATDVQTFYAALSAAEHAGTPQERLAAYRQVQALYTGDYLPELQTGWAGQARAEHQAAYVRACIALSALCCETSACEDAVTALTVALKIDPFVGENHHQKLMTCLSVTQDQYVATEHYRRFIRFLRDDLGDTPMPETSALAERVKCGEHICERALSAEPHARHAVPGPLQGHRCPFSGDGSCPSGLIELTQLN